MSTQLIERLADWHRDHVAGVHAQPDLISENQRLSARVEKLENLLTICWSYVPDDKSDPSFPAIKKIVLTDKR
jgi:hypothetical protein